MMIQIINCHIGTLLILFLMNQSEEEKCLAPGNFNGIERIIFLPAAYVDADSAVDVVEMVFGLIVAVSMQNHHSDFRCHMFEQTVVGTRRALDIAVSEVVRLEVVDDFLCGIIIVSN